MQGNQSFTLPFCKFHKENTVSHICFEDKVSLICTSCLTNSQCCANHLRFVRSITDFISNVEDNVKELRSLENLSNDRFNQLSELSGKAKMAYAKDDDNLIKEVLKALEGQNREFKEICKRQKVAQNKLAIASKLINYFQPFHDPELLEMKLNLSSPKVLKNFYKKAQSHSALLNKKVQSQLKKAEGELLTEQKKLQQLEGQSLMQKLKNLLRKAGRGEQRPMSQLKLIHKPQSSDR